MSLHPFIVFIFIKVYIESCHCTVPSNSPVISTISWTERCLLAEIVVLSAVGNTGFLSPEIVPDAHSIFPKSCVPVKNNRPRTLSPTTIITKEFPCFCRHDVTICSELYDHSLLELRLEYAFLITASASHMKTNSSSEMKACVMTSIFCMYFKQMFI